MEWYAFWCGDVVSWSEPLLLLLLLLLLLCVFPLVFVSVWWCVASRFSFLALVLISLVGVRVLALTNPRAPSVLL
jgi:hypothetical protein